MRNNRKGVIVEPLADAHLNVKPQGLSEIVNDGHLPGGLDHRSRVPRAALLPLFEYTIWPIVAVAKSDRLGWRVRR